MDEYIKALKEANGDPYCMPSQVGICLLAWSNETYENLIYFKPQKKLFLCDREWMPVKDLGGDVDKVLAKYKSEGWKTM